MPQSFLSSSTRRKFATTFAWLPALLVLVPVLAVFSRIFAPTSEAWSHVMETLLPTYLGHTFVLVFCVVGVTLLLGVPTAWWIATSSFPGRNVLRWALLLPLAMPGYIAALAYNDVMDSLVPLFIWFRTNFGMDAFLASQQITRWILAIGVLGSTLFPYVYLTSLATFSRQTGSTLEAARMLGLSRRKIFFLVALPMARPAIVAGASLVAFETLNDYGVVSYFGLTPLTVGIFRLWLSEGELNAAIRLSSFLLVFAVAGVALERWQRGHRAFTSETSETPLIDHVLTSWKSWWRLLLCLAPLFFGFLLPGYRLARWAWQSAADASWDQAWRAAWHSFSLAGTASLLIVAAAVLILATKRAVQAPSLRIAQQIGMLGYAFPSALVAVGVGALFAYLSRLPGGSQLALSASLTGLVFAYFSRFLAVGIQPVDAGFQQVSKSLHEVSRTLGTGPWRTLFLIDLPLIWPSLFAAATLTFIDIFKELTLTLVLRPFDFETLATQIVRLTDEARIPDASIPALMLISLSLIGIIPLTRFSRRAP